MLRFFEKLWWRLVGFGFRLLYNELAFTYDLVSKIVSLGAWRCWQRTALKHLAEPGDLPVLELAHGTGDLQIDLQNAGYATIGYDLSPHMGRIAGAKLRRNGLSARLVRGKAQTLPFATGGFAAVVSTFPTDFIIAPQTLREVWRVLARDGAFVVVPSGTLTGTGFIVRFIEWLYRITGQRDGDGDGPLEALMDHIRGFGFEVTMQAEECPRSRALVIIARKKDYTP